MLAKLTWLGHIRRGAAALLLSTACAAPALAQEAGSPSPGPGAGRGLVGPSYEGEIGQTEALVQAPRTVYATRSLEAGETLDRGEIRTALQELGFTEVGEIEVSHRLDRVPYETEARWQGF